MLCMSGASIHGLVGWKGRPRNGFVVPWMLEACVVLVQCLDFLMTLRARLLELPLPCWSLTI